MKISVVIPFYNLERYVRPCLDSVIAAFRKAPARVELEVICVDDGSTDATPTCLDTYTENNRQLTTDSQQPTLRIIHKPNGGEGSARNAGLEMATGDWVTFLDGDDIWLPNHLEVALPVLACAESADFVALRLETFEEGSGQCPVPGPVGVETTFDLTSYLADEPLLKVGVVPTFFRRTFIHPFRFTALPLGADRLFVAECLAGAQRGVLVDAVVYGYRLRTDSMAHRNWTATKVASQCEYAYGSLKRLVASRKTLGRAGQGYLASLWLSDVPNRLLRLPLAERRKVWSRWQETLKDDEVVCALPQYDLVRRILRVLRFSAGLTLFVARLLRKGGVT